MNQTTSSSLPFALYRPQSGHPDWLRLHAEALALAAELRPTLEAPRGGLAEARRRLKSYRTGAANFLTNRRRAAAGREDFMPLYFIWTTRRRCNFACTYCDDHQGKKYPDLPEQGLLDETDGERLLEVMRTGTSSVYFAGGEPTLRKDLPQLTRRARDLAYYPIVINTNASAVDRLLKRPGWQTWLADTDVVVVSLDALDLGLLKKMWVYRRPQDVLRNLLLLRELAQEMRIKLLVNCVIQPDTLAEAGAVLDLCCDLGIEFSPVPVNVGPTVDRGLQESDDYRRLVDTIIERKRAGYGVTGSERMLGRLMRSEPFDCRNTLKPHIDYDGALLWPCKSSQNVAPEHVQVLDFPDVETLYDHARGLVDPTGFHGPGAEQCGASCNWAQNYSTDAYFHGLSHPASLIRDVVAFSSTRR